MEAVKTIDFNTLWREIKRAREYRNAHTREETCPIPQQGGRVTDIKDMVKDTTWLVRWSWTFHTGITAPRELVQHIRDEMVASSGCTINGEEVGYCNDDGIDLLKRMQERQWLTIMERHKWTI